MLTTDRNLNELFGNEAALAMMGRRRDDLQAAIEKTLGVHEERFVSIPVTGLRNPGTGTEQSLVVVRMPWRITTEAFAMAIEDIRETVFALGGLLRPTAMMRADGPREREALLRMVSVHGHMGYRVDAKGSVTRFDPSVEPETEFLPSF